MNPQQHQELLKSRIRGIYGVTPTIIQKSEDSSSVKKSDEEESDEEKEKKKKKVKTNGDGIHSVEHNGSTYYSKPNELKEDFKERAKKTIKDDHKDDVDFEGEKKKD